MSEATARIDLGGDGTCHRHYYAEATFECAACAIPCCLECVGDTVPQKLRNLCRACYNKELLKEATTRYCAAHQGRETKLSCGACSRSYCSDCVRVTEVGMRCFECARPRRATLRQRGPKSLVLVAGLIVAAVAGVWFVGGSPVMKSVTQAGGLVNGSHKVAVEVTRVEAMDWAPYFEGYDPQEAAEAMEVLGNSLVEVEITNRGSTALDLAADDATPWDIRIGSATIEDATTLFVGMDEYTKLATAQGIGTMEYLQAIEKATSVTLAPGESTKATIFHPSIPEDATAADVTGLDYNNLEKGEGAWFTAKVTASQSSGRAEAKADDGETSFELSEPVVAKVGGADSNRYVKFSATVEFESPMSDDEWTTFEQGLRASLIEALPQMPGLTADAMLDTSARGRLEDGLVSAFQRNGQRVSDFRFTEVAVQR